MPFSHVLCHYCNNSSAAIYKGVENASEYLSTSLECGLIKFNNHQICCSDTKLCPTPTLRPQWTAATRFLCPLVSQASTGWACHSSSPGDLLTESISPVLQADSLLQSHWGSQYQIIVMPRNGNEMKVRKWDPQYLEVW